MAERFNAIVGANIRSFVARMRQVHDTLTRTATGADANIGANVREFNARMTLVRQSLRNVQYANSEATISADISSFNRTMAMLKAKMLALSSSRVVVQVKTDWSQFRAGWQAGQQMMGKIASSIRNFGEVIGQTLQGAFISVLPAISPIIANIGGLIGSLGPVIGTVAGQAAGLGTAFIIGYAGLGTVIAGVTSQVTALYKKNAVLNTQQKETKKALDGVKATYNELMRITQQPILDGVKTGAQIATKLLKELEPLFTNSAMAFKNLMSDLKKSIGTPPIQKFLDYLNKDGATMLTRFAQSFGNIFKGLASMLTAFAPLANSTSKGFLDMSKSFADWAAGLGKSEKFKAFIEYVQTNIPKLKSIFGDAIVGIVNVFSAFGPMSSNMMTSLQGLMAKFKEWSASLSQNQAFQKFCDYVVQTAPSVMSLIGNLTTFLVNLGVGMAPLGQKILEIANNFLTWVNNMMSGNPVIGQIIAVVTSLTGVVMAVLPWILSMGASFIKLLAPGTTANAILTKVGQVITSIIPTILNLASKALPWLIRGFGLLTGPVGIAIAIITTLISVGILLYKNWDTIKAKCAELAKTVVSKITELSAKGIAKFNELKDQATQKFNDLKIKAVAKVVELVTLAITKFTELKTKATAKIVELVTQAVSKFTNLKTQATQKVADLKTATVNKFNDLKTSAVNKVTELATSAVNKFGELKTSASNKVAEMKTAVANKFQEMVTAIGSKMSDMKSKIESGWNKAKSFLSGINLVSIGSNIIQGLINGIQSKVGAVISTVKSIADKVTSTIKKAMDIHSPSRVTYALGEHTGQGYANGISSKAKSTAAAAKKVVAAAKKAFTDAMKGLDLKLQAGSISTASYVKQAKALGTKYKSVTNAKNTVAAKVQKATTAKAIKEQKARQAKQTKLNKQLNDKISKLDNKYASGQMKAKDYINNMTQIKTTAHYNGLETVANRATSKIISAKKKEASAVLATEKTKVSNLLQSGKLLTDKQLKYIEDTAKSYGKGTKERAYFEKQLSTALKNNYNLQYEANKQKVSDILADENMSAVEQLKAIDKITKGYKKGTNERAYFEQQYAEKKKTIYDGLIALNGEYTAKIQEANQKLIDGEKSLNDEYAKAVADCANTIKNFVGIFDEIPQAAETSGQQLKDNLQAQVDTIRSWSENIASLVSRGIDKGLLQELQTLGPSAAGQIAALNTLSDTELQEYVGLWQEKSTLATSIATTELESMRLDTIAQIEQLRKDTATQLTTYKSEWQAKIKELTGGTKNEFNALTASMPAIGKNVIKGMQNGLTAMTPALLKQAQSIADSMKATIQKALDIHSPSKWGKNFIGKNLVLGIINGISNMKSKAVSTALELANEVKQGMTSGLVQNDVLGYTAASTSAISKELKVKVNVDVNGDDSNNGNGVGVVNQEVHLHSPRELSPSENARLMKKQAQKLAQEWG